MAATATPIGEHLRQWRQRRRLSQLAFALQADVSQRHLSCLESGKAAPSREMVLRLAEQLQVPLRERNAMLVAAGYAPLYAERPLDDPALAPVRQAVQQVLQAHEPWPALAIDRHWQLVAANRMLPLLLAGVGSGLMAPPVNVLRLSLHPDGLAPRILNYRAWRAHLLERLRQQAGGTGDPVLAALLQELQALPSPASVEAAAPGPVDDPEPGGIAMPLRLSTPVGPLSLLSTTTVFGTPRDITLAELALEAFYPADEATAQRLRRLAEPGRTPL
ncbi:MAG: helix-turn-helix domain-containing protein [Aquincola tertiaricarbonis]